VITEETKKSSLELIEELVLSNKKLSGSKIFFCCPENFIKEIDKGFDVFVADSRVKNFAQIKYWVEIKNKKFLMAVFEIIRIKKLPLYAGYSPN
jgi:hypothetical protein